MAFGPTMALIGDNPNPRIDPEVVAPFSKSEPYLASNGRKGERSSLTVVNKFRNGTIRSASAYENEVVRNFV